MQLLSNLSQIVKSTSGDAKKLAQRTLSRSDKSDEASSADASADLQSDATIRRPLPTPKPSEMRAARKRASADASEVDMESAAIAKFMGDTAAPRRAPSTAQPVSMWRSVDDLTPAAASKPVPKPTRKTAGRVKTKLLSFDDAADMPRSVLETTAPAASSPNVAFPVGWLILTDGPGRGACFTLKAGVSQIGRETSETISLGFGDLSISRSNHASIAYDPDDHKFYMGHGGKANIVRLNGKPVLSTEELQSGDVIRIGETTLRLVTFCNEEFNWGDASRANAALLAG